MSAEIQETRIRRALAAIDRLQDQLRAHSEPIAIVGMACRFPGGCANVEEYWSFLERGGDGIREIPADRWDMAGLYNENPDTPGTLYCRHGGYLENVDRFDADFFGISPREAQCIDPQHRLLLETAWTALEDAGIASLAGLTAGVFAGICLNDYATHQLNGPDRTRITPYDGSGNAFCFASGRLSYFLGAQGPSLAVDTACSSSLVALHLACLSLRNQECDVALAGAAQLHLSPETSIFLSRSKALAPDGACKPFDAAADGFGRGEGCGVVVLKRLSDALAAKDLIRAVIRGSAVNHDGRSSGLTVPNQLAQEQLMRRALANAKVQASDVDYVEAHGTGTSLGDPIEMAALSAVFGGARPCPLRVGSVKSNFGHLEAASGMAGLLKVVLALEHGTIPRNLRFHTPNPLIPWSDIPVEIPVANVEGVRMAGLSSFGFSGTNAHVVLEAASISEAVSSAESPAALTLSAKSEPALKDLATRYSDFLETSPETFTDICYSAAVTRTPFEFSLTLEASSRADAAAQLRDFVANRRIEPAHRPPPATGKRVRLPHYPFQQRAYWVQKSEVATHFPGKRLRSAGREIVFELELGADSWLGEHRVRGNAILPLAVFATLAIEAASILLRSENLELSGLAIHAPATLPEHGTRVFQTILTPEPEGVFGWKVFGQQANTDWELHASGTARVHDGQPRTAKSPNRGELIDVTGFYADFAARGLDYGPRFRLLETLERGPDCAFAQVAAPTDPIRGLLHPAQLDACFQSLAAAFPSLPAGEAFLPVAIERFRLYRRHAQTLRCEARATTTDGPSLTGELNLSTAAGEPVASIEGFTARRSAPAATPILYTPEWMPQPRTGVALPPARWIVLADNSGIGAALHRLLDRSILVPRGTPIDKLDLTGAYVVHLWSLDEDAAHAELCTSVLKLAATLGEGSRLWLVTRGGQPMGADTCIPDPRQAPVWGLGRTLANERPELRCTCIDLEPDTSPLDALFAELTEPDSEDQVAFRAGVRHTARLTRRADVSVEPCRLAMPRAGTLADLAFVPAPRRRPAAGQVEIDVRTAALNFKDVLHALNLVPFDGEVPLGFECAGIVTETGAGVDWLEPGDRVVAVLTPGAIGDWLLADARFVVRIPDGISFAHAATLPIAFLTAALALEALRPGQTVLIHAAAGGVGQAAVQLGQRAGATIFATASASKHDYLRAQGIQHIFDSRTLSFDEQILDLTNGEGVDLVLNSLKDEFASASLRVLKPKGRFVEIGALAAPHEPGIDYRHLHLGQVAERDPARISSLLTGILRDTADGKLRPLTHELFPLRDAPDAFRRMAQGKHTGKLIISVKDTGGAYLITGGCGALGLQVARWLADRGAAAVHLAGRSTPSDLTAVRAIEARGTRVILHARDISDPAAVDRLFDDLDADGEPLRGVVHAAAVLEDGVLARESWDGLSRVFAAKVAGASNLHQRLGSRPLDFFVCFSSFAALYGSPGQGAYAAANCYLDALMHHRRRLGLAGLSVNWGSWAGDGMARDSQLRSASHGVRPLAPERALAALGALINSGDGQACVLDADWPRLLSQLGHVPSMLRGFEPRIITAAPIATLESRLRTAPPGQRSTLLLRHLQTQLAVVLNLDPEQAVPPRKGFFDCGLDSLMAVELRNRLQSDLAVSLPATLLFDQPHLEALADYLLREKLAFATADAEDKWSEDEVAALLAGELASLETERLHG